jgi:hypothetical protein
VTINEGVAMDKLREVYERYKHLDAVLSDPEWAGDNIPYRMTIDMWKAIKETLLIL